MRYQEEHGNSKKSQLGDGEDIKHELECLENPNYSVSANVTACWGGMKQEAIRLCGACYSESPCHKIECQFKTVTGCVSEVPAKQARHQLCLLLECPNCGARFKVPALSVDGQCQRCLMGFGERANWQEIIV